MEQGESEGSGAGRQLISNGGILRNILMIKLELPSTGGPGTTTLYIIGSILAIIAAYLLIAKRRTEYIQRD